MSRSNNSNNKYRITAGMQLKFARAARRLEGRTIRGGAHLTSRKDAASREDNELRIYRGKPAGFGEAMECGGPCEDECFCDIGEYEEWVSQEEKQLREQIEQWRRDRHALRERIVRARRRFAHNSDAWEALTDLLDYIYD